LILKNKIPVIDLFAGPGGLGEGFSCFQEDGYQQFDLRLSIEKDLRAIETLRLRAFFRAFGKGLAPDLYYDYIRGSIDRRILQNTKYVQSEWEKANVEVRQATLGDIEPVVVDAWLGESLKNEADWVLIGGPPCQAYSMVGRSRMRGSNPIAFERDKRHFLYREYLRIIKKFQPTVFVMENVKGLLTSMHGGSLIFDRIRDDLSRPSDDLEYEIRSLVMEGPNIQPKQFIIESENYGIPQARHRVILLGVRRSHSHIKNDTLLERDRVTVQDVISLLPRIRSRLSNKSGRVDNFCSWQSVLESALGNIVNWRDDSRDKILEMMKTAVQDSRKHESAGGLFIPQVDQPDSLIKPKRLAEFILDQRVGGVTLHESRSHMPSDLHRYLFAACYGELHHQSPKLRNFPSMLWPDHKNLDGSLRTSEVPFEDRFRVQPWNSPSTTIMSHMAKDGHYFIHPDPSQCRSFTVREAARLQTFPDNYFFEGNRTGQYTQVGNAVPPYLAMQIAKVVYGILKARETSRTQDEPT